MVSVAELNFLPGSSGCGIQRWLDSNILVGFSESAELFQKCLKETDFKFSSQYCDSEKETFPFVFFFFFMLIGGRLRAWRPYEGCTM